jgi:hypothetical protein
MDKELKIALTKHLEYLTTLPETRLNNSMIDCCVFMLQEKPDTKESLNGN